MGSKQYTSEMKNAVNQNSTQAFLKLMRADYIQSCKRIKPELSERSTLTLSRLNAQYQFAQLVESCDAKQHRTIIAWILKTKGALNKFTTTLKKEDKIEKVFSILEALRQSDPKNFEAYFNLALAVAVVWDVTPAKIHGQMGRNTLKYSSSSQVIYSYFKALYLSKKAKIKYEKLRINELIFVVNTPVPISELKWAKKNVRGSAKSWRKKYAEIEYDTPRLAANELSWPSYNEDYTLENIEKHGGICVDQAYFATMSGRANGIPTLFFSGKGRNGGHAWFGYYIPGTNWVTDVGKYSTNNFAIGHTTNPQTNRRISDHELDFLTNRKFSRASYQRATVFITASRLLTKSEAPKLALRFAKMTRKGAPLYDESWDYLEKELLAKRNQAAITKFYITKLRVFKDYKDIHTVTERKYAAYLSTIGKGKKADRIFKDQINELGSERTDLAKTALLSKFNALKKTKKVEEATKLLEDFIKDNIAESALVFSIMNQYLNYGSEAHFEKKACKFIKKIYSKMARTVDDFAVMELMNLMKKAYLLAGDKKSTAKIDKSIAKFTKDQKKQAKKDRSHDKRRKEQVEEKENNYRQ